MPTHNEIANRVSTHREAVTRVMSDLLKLGITSKAGHRKLKIKDIQNLEKLTEKAEE